MTLKSWTAWKDFPTWYQGSMKKVKTGFVNSRKAKTRFGGDLQVTGSTRACVLVPLFGINFTLKSGFRILWTISKYSFSKRKKLRHSETFKSFIHWSPKYVILETGVCIFQIYICHLTMTKISVVYQVLDYSALLRVTRYNNRYMLTATSHEGWICEYLYKKNTKEAIKLVNIVCFKFIKSTSSSLSYKSDL